MPATQFNRDLMAQRYAEAHLETDPGIIAVYFLPTGAGEREIRFVEVNQLMGNRTDAALEPIDFGMDRGTDTAHRLLVLDVTPSQWERIEGNELLLPAGWTLEGAVTFPAP